MNISELISSGKLEYTLGPEISQYAYCEYKYSQITTIADIKVIMKAMKLNNIIIRMIEQEETGDLDDIFDSFEEPNFVYISKAFFSSHRVCLYEYDEYGVLRRDICDCRGSKQTIRVALEMLSR